LSTIKSFQKARTMTRSWNTVNEQPGNETKVLAWVDCNFLLHRSYCEFPAIGTRHVPRSWHELLSREASKAEQSRESRCICRSVVRGVTIVFHTNRSTSAWIVISKWSRDAWAGFQFFSIADSGALFAELYFYQTLSPMVAIIPLWSTKNREKQSISNKHYILHPDLPNLADGHKNPKYYYLENYWSHLTLLFLPTFQFSMQQVKVGCLLGKWVSTRSNKSAAYWSKDWMAGRLEEQLLSSTLLRWNCLLRRSPILQLCTTANWGLWGPWYIDRCYW
jgi:hypothetical protein